MERAQEGAIAVYASGGWIEADKDSNLLSPRWLPPVIPRILILANSAVVALMRRFDAPV